MAAANSGDRCGWKHQEKLCGCKENEPHAKTPCGHSDDLGHPTGRHRAWRPAAAIDAHRCRAGRRSGHRHPLPLTPLPVFPGIRRLAARLALPDIWTSGYSVGPLPRWTPGTRFDEWWRTASPVFDDARATSTYRYRLPAFGDLYGADFDVLTVDQARRVNQQVQDNYRSEKWVYEVVARRAKIELMLIDTFWCRCDVSVTTPSWSRYCGSTRCSGVPIPTSTRGAGMRTIFAGRTSVLMRLPQGTGCRCGNFDDYLALADAIFKAAVEHGAVSIKSRHGLSPYAPRGSGAPRAPSGPLADAPMS